MIYDIHFTVKRFFLFFGTLTLFDKASDELLLSQILFYNKNNNLQLNSELLHL